MCLNLQKFKKQFSFHGGPPVPHHIQQQSSKEPDTVYIVCINYLPVSQLVVQLAVVVALRTLAQSSHLTMTVKVASHHVVLANQQCAAGCPQLKHCNNKKYKILSLVFGNF